MAREYAVEIRCAGVTDEDFLDEIPKIRGDGEIAPLVELLGLDAWPLAEDAAPPYAASHHERNAAVSVVRAPVAVLQVSLGGTSYSGGSGSARCPHST